MLDELLQTLRNPHALHAAAVHLPIALTLLAAFLAVVWAGLAAAKKPSAGLRWAAVTSLAFAAVGAGIAAGAGEEAMEAVSALSPTLTPQAAADLDRHEDLGEGGWKWPAGAAVLLAAAGWVRPTRAAAVATVLAVAATLGVATWAGLTGHTGGRLVYTHGLGVPKRAAHTTAPAAPGALAEPSGGEIIDD